MHFGQGQTPYLPVEDILERLDPKPLDLFKDLGAVHSPEVKHHVQQLKVVPFAFILDCQVRCLASLKEHCFSLRPGVLHVPWGVPQRRSLEVIREILRP